MLIERLQTINDERKMESASRKTQHGEGKMQFVNTKVAVGQPLNAV